MTEKLDELEGREEECLYDFERDLDAAFWEEWETAVHSTGLGHEEYRIRSQEEIQAGVDALIGRTLPTDAQIESWTMRTAEENVRIAGEVLHSVAEDGSSIPPVPVLKDVDWKARIDRMMALADELPPAPVSIPDKLYAKARAEGYEAGMADAALIAGRYLDGCLICEACTNECCKIVTGYLTDVHDCGARCSYKFLAEGA